MQSCVPDASALRTFSDWCSLCRKCGEGVVTGHVVCKLILRRRYGPGTECRSAVVKGQHISSVNELCFDAAFYLILSALADKKPLQSLQRLLKFK